MNGAASGSGPNSVSGGSERFQGSIEGSPRYFDITFKYSKCFFINMFFFIESNLESTLLVTEVRVNLTRAQLPTEAEVLRLVV